MFQFQCGAIGSLSCANFAKSVRRFNSSVVRLVVPLPIPLSNNSACFNSSVVRLVVDAT